VGDDVETLAKRVRDRAAQIAEGHGMQYAEAFRRMVLRRPTTGTEA